ncbi:hypothetical protein BC826DRAFT_1017003 [Russula brevipes]|nr:hypothetical protein BC826DRAFT_1017003 [Russula brevipes]
MMRNTPPTNIYPQPCPPPRVRDITPIPTTWVTQQPVRAPQKVTSHARRPPQPSPSAMPLRFIERQPQRTRDPKLCQQMAPSTKHTKP